MEIIIILGVIGAIVGLADICAIIYVLFDIIKLMKSTHHGRN
jgi:hypothetical protein